MTKGDAREPPRSIAVLECPDCGGQGISYAAGLETGHRYECPDCGYVGAFVIERDQTPAELRRRAGLGPPAFWADDE